MPRTDLSEFDRTKERKPAASHCLCRAHERKDTSHSQLDARHALFPALCTSLILHSPGASRLRQSLPCFSPSLPQRSVVPDKSGFIPPSPPPRVPRPMQPKRGPSASAFPEFPALAFSSLSPLSRSSPPQGTKKAGERPRPVVFCKAQSHTSMTDVPRRTSST